MSPHPLVEATRPYNLSPRPPSSCLLEHLAHLVEVVDEPVGALADRLALHDAAEADECVGAAGQVARLHVGRAVADHHHRVVAMDRLDVLDRLRLAARLRLGLFGLFDELFGIFKILLFELLRGRCALR